jgi:hypothetical protein
MQKLFGLPSLARERKATENAMWNCWFEPLKSFAFRNVRLPIFMTQRDNQLRWHRFPLSRGFWVASRELTWRANDASHSAFVDSFPQFLRLSYHNIIRIDQVDYGTIHNLKYTKEYTEVIGKRLSSVIHPNAIQWGLVISGTDSMPSGYHQIAKRVNYTLQNKNRIIDLFAINSSQSIRSFRQLRQWTNVTPVENFLNCLSRSNAISIKFSSRTEISKIDGWFLCQW